MANVSQIFSEHVAKTTFADLKPADVEWAKRRVADSLGVMLVGVHGLKNEEVLNLLKRWGGNPEATVFNYGIKLPVQNAAFMNSLMLRAFDFEVIDAELPGNKTAPAHITGATMPVLLSLGEITGASGKDLLTALILGDDLAARLIYAGGFGVYDCFDGNGTADCMAATTVAAKILGLDAEKILHSYGMALNMCSGTMENVFSAVWAFKLPIAMSSMRGILAAEMAEAGLTGVPDPIGGVRCYFDSFKSEVTHIDEFLNDLGDKYYSDVVVKPGPSCHGTHYPMDAAWQITGGKPYEPEEIESIRIHVSAYNKGFVGQPFDFGNIEPQVGGFSIRYTVADIVLRGNLVPDHYTPEAMTDPKMKAMLDKIDILDDGPKKGALVEITFADGTTKALEVNESLGHIHKTPMTDEQLHDKFVRNVEYANIVPLDVAEKAYELALHLDELDNIQPIYDLLIP